VTFSNTNVLVYAAAGVAPLIDRARRESSSRWPGSDQPAYLPLEEVWA
jgi:hypothetical protein